MKDLEIFQKACEKAMEAGWLRGKVKMSDARVLFLSITELSWEKRLKDTKFQIIFSHEFAKCFWGDEIVKDNLCYECGMYDIQEPAWQYHLQKMVLEKEPLEYLERFL